MAMKTCQMPKGWFRRRVEQARGSYARERLEELRLSMETHGQLQPVGALGDGSLIWGYRRLEAALESDKIQELLTAVLDREITESEFRILNLTENFQRCDLTAYEKAKACKELLDLNPGWKSKGVAEHLHIDPSMITRLLSLFSCIPAVQEAAAAGQGRLGVSDWYAISRAEPCDQHELLAARFDGASRDELEAHARRQRNGTTQSAKTSRRVKLALGDGVGVAVTGPQAMSLDDLVQVVGRAGEALKRAKREGWDLGTLIRVLANKAKGGEE